MSLGVSNKGLGFQSDPYVHIIIYTYIFTQIHWFVYKYLYKYTHIHKCLYILMSLGVSNKGLGFQSDPKPDNVHLI
jgi:hypothetical protein